MDNSKINMLVAKYKSILQIYDAWPLMRKPETMAAVEEEINTRVQEVREDLNASRDIYFILLLMQQVVELFDQLAKTTE